MKSALDIFREIRDGGRFDTGRTAGEEHHPVASAPRSLPSDPAGDQLDFIEDDSIPAAIFHSRALDRRFVLARDEAALEALTSADRDLPVLYFSDCAHVRALGIKGLRVLLDLRAGFGPSVDLRSVKAANG